MGKSGREFREGFKGSHRDQHRRNQKRSWLEAQEQRPQNAQHERPYRKAA
jgi:hypothetical protein